MSKVYLINVGANGKFSSKVRCPIFKDGSFEFVSYHDPGAQSWKPYPANVHPFIRNLADFRETHLDPDWKNLTYGDFCSNPRASALRSVAEDDILLFWALLWENRGTTWENFTKRKSWYLIGALRVREILKPGQGPEAAKATRVARAAENAHFHLHPGQRALDEGHYVFIGCTKRSGLFSKAIDLQVEKSDGLLYRTIRSADGKMLSRGGQPKWYTSLRSCRLVWDLERPDQRVCAEVARNAILDETGFDLLSGL